MKRARHDPISQVECLLNSIPMMNININVQNSLKSLQQLENSQHTIVYIAKTRCFGLFCVMQTSRPVDSVLVLALSN